LLVWELGSGESETAVKLADTLVDITVLLEELELHSVALSVGLGGLSDDVVDLDVGGGVCLLVLGHVTSEG